MRCNCWVVLHGEELLKQEFMSYSKNSDGLFVSSDPMKRRDHEGLKLSSLERRVFTSFLSFRSVVQSLRSVKTSFCVTIKIHSVHIRNPQITVGRVFAMPGSLRCGLKCTV